MRVRIRFRVGDRVRGGFGFQIVYVVVWFRVV